MRNNNPHIALCFVNFGPYHLARLNRCLDSGLNVTGVQLAPTQAEYAWKTEAHAHRLVNVYSGQLEQIRSGEWKAHVFQALDKLNPDVCAIAGYGMAGMRAIILWCHQRQIPAVLMSDTLTESKKRNWLKESVKRIIVKPFRSAFVAGTPHIDFVESLGIPRSQVFLGYDVVDNDYFSSASDEARCVGDQLRIAHSLPKSYFLTIARFLPYKNIFTVLTGYSRYLNDSKAADKWDFVLVGDGVLKPDILKHIKALKIESRVYLPGFIQHQQIPSYYAFASAFVLGSVGEETWGLVVNEAMASGLPVIVSKQSGCSKDLVHEGRNGYQYDGTNADELACYMAKISSDETKRGEMGRESRKIIAKWTLQYFADNLRDSCVCAMQQSSRVSWLESVLLNRFL